MRTWGHFSRDGGLPQRALRGKKRNPGIRYHGLPSDSPLHLLLAETRKRELQVDG